MPKYILFDTETTGNSEEDRIIQIGLMVVHDKNNIEVFDELCSSEVDIKLEAMEVHNIVPEMLINKPPFQQTDAYKKLQEYNNKTNYLIAHNIKFDLEMIEKENFKSNYTIIDTLRCARHLYSELPYHRLQYLRYALKLYKYEEIEAKKLGITIKAHDAIGDVLIMKLFLSELIKKIQQDFTQINPIKKLVELSNTPVEIKTFKFGKYKGKDIKEIALQDRGYLEWMLSNMDDLDDDMKYTLKSLL